MKTILNQKNSPTVIPAIYIEYLEEIDDYLNKLETEGRKISTVFIDEAQFLKGDVSVLSDLSVYKNIDFYIAGLDMTSEQKPFGLMPFILAIANNVKKIKGYCVECNKESEFTYYDGEKDGDVLVGDGNYECLCRKCLEKKPVKIRKKVK